MPLIPCEHSGQYSGSFGLKQRENLKTGSLVEFRGSVGIRVVRELLTAPLLTTVSSPAPSIAPVTVLA